MTAPVEAQSLSSLNHLFSNPPQYPRNPTHDVHEPLVLYIVRVPGSKDVFLTPLKPPTKSSISLEAIQSSLYYLHVPVPEDEEMRSSIEHEWISEERELESVARKPLPSTPFANYPPSERPFPPPKSYPHFQPGLNGPNDTQTDRLAARASHLRLDPPRDEMQRIPLGPRQFRQRKGNGQQEANAIRSQQESLPQPYSVTQQRDSSESTRSSLHSQNESGLLFRRSISPVRRCSTDHQNVSGTHNSSITLIRRDPASGGQWNIGTVSQMQSNLSGSNLCPVLVELTTPGYSRFSGQQEMVRPNTAGSDAASMREMVDSVLTSPVENRSYAFSRVVDYRPLDGPDTSNLNIRRTGSANSVAVSPGTTTKPEKSILSFVSPWQGTCTFSNGVDGRTLRCRHTIPMTNAVEDLTTTVAELRFNLPWSVLGAKDANRLSEVEPDKLPISKLLETKRQNFRRSVQKMKHRRTDSDFVGDGGPNGLLDRGYVDQYLPKPVECQSDRISLRLGREKAGGGFRGKSAKLGKLIIEDEGLKMCDLLVAACMGVWWQHYQNRSN